MDYNIVWLVGACATGIVLLPLLVALNVFVAWNRKRSDRLKIKYIEDWLLLNLMVLIVAVLFATFWFVSIPALALVLPIIGMLWGVGHISEKTKKEAK
jgi:amino acid transporter